MAETQQQMKASEAGRELVACKTCGHLLSTLAEACPQCGAPNEWQHPIVAKLYADRAVLATPRRFHLQIAKGKAFGQTNVFAPLWAWGLMLLLIGVGGFVGLALIGMWGPLLAGMLAALPVLLTRRSESFEADLIAGTWASTNDAFWADVKKRLMTR